MDTDISHSVQAELDALSARIDALENPQKPDLRPPDENGDEEEVEPEPVEEY